MSTQKGPKSNFIISHELHPQTVALFDKAPNSLSWILFRLKFGIFCDWIHIFGPTHVIVRLNLCIHNIKRKGEREREGEEKHACMWHVSVDIEMRMHMYMHMMYMSHSPPWALADVDRDSSSHVAFAISTEHLRRGRSGEPSVTCPQFSGRKLDRHGHIVYIWICTYTSVYVDWNIKT